MFDYGFPIFCFGLVITGVVFLGLMEAAEQVKREASEKLRDAERTSVEPEPAPAARQP